MCSHPRDRQFAVPMRNAGYEVDIVQCFRCGDVVPDDKRLI